MLKIFEISWNHVLVILKKKQSDTRMKSGRIAPISSDRPDDSTKNRNTAAYGDRNTTFHRMNNIKEYSINMQKRKHPPFTVSAFLLASLCFNHQEKVSFWILRNWIHKIAS